MSTEKQPEALAGSAINHFCGNCKDGYPGGQDNCGKCHSHSHWTPLLLPSTRPVAPELVEALFWIDDFIARCNGDDRGACESVEVLRHALLGTTPAQCLQQPEPTRISLPVHRHRRVYVAGPMTGLPEFNFPAFNSTAAMLRAEGWHVENPAEHGIVDGAEWADYLHYDLWRLATCCAIYLLPGWSKSRGAALEVHIARALGMEFYYDDDAEVEAAPQQSPQFVIDLP